MNESTENDLTKENSFSSNFLFSTLGIDFNIDPSLQSDNERSHALSSIPADVLENSIEIEKGATTPSTVPNNKEITNDPPFFLGDDAASHSFYGIFQDEQSFKRTDSKQHLNVLDYQDCFPEIEETVFVENIENMSHVDEPSGSMKSITIQPTEMEKLESIPTHDQFVDTTNKRCAVKMIGQPSKDKLPMCMEFISTHRNTTSPQNNDLLCHVQIVCKALEDEICSAKEILEDTERLTEQGDNCISTSHAYDMNHLFRELEASTVETTKISLRNLLVYGLNKDLSNTDACVPLHIAVRSSLERISEMEEFLREC